MLYFPGALLFALCCTAFVISSAVFTLLKLLGGVVNFSVLFFSFFLEAFLKMAFYNFCISWSCNKFLHFSSLKTWIFWCLVVRSSLLSLNILMSSFAYCTYLTSPSAFFPLASSILLLIFFGVRFLNFFSSLIFAWLFHFSVCSLCLFVFWKFFFLYPMWDSAALIMVCFKFSKIFASDLSMWLQD